MRRLIGTLAGACAVIGVAYAQFGRGNADWATTGGDAQRSSWVRTDAKITTESVQKPPFQFLWKLKLGDARQVNSLSSAVLLNSYIGYRGFRSLGYVGGSADTVSAIDTDLGRVEWQKTLGVKGARPAPTAACPGGMTANVALATTPAFPTSGPAGRGGRTNPAHSAAGDPGAGAVTIAQVRAAAAAAGRGAPPAAAARRKNLVYAIASDGMLHGLYVSNGEEPDPPVRFLPPGADAHGLIVVDNVAYVGTAHGCAGVPDGIWAVDLESKEVHSWKSANGGVAGTEGMAMAPDGTLFVSTLGGELVALESKTLAPKQRYSAGQAFATSPVVFQDKDRALVAAATKDGRIHVLDAASPGTPLFQSSGSSASPTELSTWQDAGGTRWLLGAGENAIVAWKVGESSLQPGWTSPPIASPMAPMIINGVVFAVSGGASAAVVYTLDGATGKELWNSANAVSSPVHRGGLSGGAGQLYLGTDDGTFYAFGMWMEH